MTATATDSTVKAMTSYNSVKATTTGHSIMIQTMSLYSTMTAMTTDS